MLDFLIDLEMERFLDKYRTILLTLPSYHDLKNENSYYMMILGMCVCLSHDYEIISNKEVGKGRCDIILKAKSVSMPSFVLEFKYINEEVKDSEVSNKLKELANNAVHQIEEKKYDVSLNGEIIHIGLAHYSKIVEMCWN